MKKYCIIALALALVFSLCACGRRNNQETTPDTKAPTIIPPTTILDPTIMDPTLDTNIPDSNVDTHMTDPSDNTATGSSSDMSAH